MKKILVTVVLFLVSCSSGTSEAEIKTDAKEIGNSLVNATSKIEEKPSMFDMKNDLYETNPIFSEDDSKESKENRIKLEPLFLNLK